MFEEKKAHTHTYISSGWLSHLFCGTWVGTWLSPNKRATLLKTNSSPPVGGRGFVTSGCNENPKRNWNESSSTHEFSGANLLWVSWYQLRRVPFHRLIEACWVLWWLGYHSSLKSLNLYQWCLDNSLELLDDKFWLESFNKKHRKPTLPSSINHFLQGLFGQDVQGKYPDQARAKNPQMLLNAPTTSPKGESSQFMVFWEVNPHNFFWLQVREWANKTTD